MKKVIFEKGLYTRYLDILGIKVKRADLLTLNELIKKQLEIVPFENISKLFYKKYLIMNTIPDLKHYLDGIEKFHFGGTCYTNNYYFSGLLKFLGFKLKFCSADMTKPDVHSVIIVTLDDNEFLVDVGYAAPLNLPVPLKLKKDFEVEFGLYRYIFKPKNKEGKTKLEMYYNGELKHGYLLKQNGKNINDFEDAIHDSFREEATFMNSILLTKTISGVYIRINNFELSESTSNNTIITTVKNKKELVELIEKKFMIPGSISKGIINEMDLNGKVLN